MSDTPQLVFPDEATAADFRQYVERAKRLDGDGAIRLQSTGTVLAAWVCALPGAGLLGNGVVLGLRTLHLGEPASDNPMHNDWCTPIAAFTDRFARGALTRVPLPPTTVNPPWAAVTPPRTGWAPVGQLDVDTLRMSAETGIERVKAGEDAEDVWRERVQGDVRAGMAFAAHALGFLAGDRADVFSCGNWTRLSTPTGHVLSR